MADKIEPLLVAVDEGAAMLGLGRSKTYELVNEGKVKLVKIGRRSMLSVDSLKTFAASLQAA